LEVIKFYKIFNEDFGCNYFTISFTFLLWFGQQKTNGRSSKGLNLQQKYKYTFEALSFSCYIAIQFLELSYFFRMDCQTQVVRSFSCYPISSAWQVVFGGSFSLSPGFLLQVEIFLFFIIGLGFAFTLSF